MKDFNYWKKQHESERLEEFNFDQNGLLWLKIKSILRKELVAEFVINSKIVLKETALAKQFVELYDILVENREVSHLILDAFIQNINDKQANELDTQQLVS
jgi:hypothetical protein